MKTSNTTVKIALAWLAVASLGGQPFMSAAAEDSGGLKAEQPSFDTPPAHGLAVLNGSVIKWGHAQAKGDSSAGTTPAASPDPAAPAAGHAGSDLPQVHDEDIDRLLLSGSAREDGMTGEDYRQLGFGITGMETFRMLFARYPVVVRVFPGCPAERAGIQPGDLVLSAGGHEFTRRDMQREHWRLVDGRAGTEVDIKVLRDGEVICFHLTRMNIEDIPDENLRHMFERMLQLFGPPSS